MHLKENRILYYHVIADKLPDIYPHGISLHGLMRQMNWLKRFGWSLIKLSDAINGIVSSSRNLCITLDDGLACCYPALMQIIQSYKIKPTLFLIGKCLDNRALAWNHKLILLRKYVPLAKLDQQISKIIPGADQSCLFFRISLPEKDLIMDRLWSDLLPWTQAEYLARNKPFLTREQLQTLVDKGVELGLHSHTHPDFSRLDHQTAYQEMQANLQALENLKLPYHRLLAYPYGRCPEPGLESFLQRELKITAFFGTRYAQGDNQPKAQRWQRQNLEQAGFKNLTEFFLKPQLRGIKAYL